MRLARMPIYGSVAILGTMSVVSMPNTAYDNHAALDQCHMTFMRMLMIEIQDVIWQVACCLSYFQ